jgi:hypothetical protein
MNLGRCAFVGHEFRVSKDAAGESREFFSVLA